MDEDGESPAEENGDSAVGENAEPTVSPASPPEENLEIPLEASQVEAPQRSARNATKQAKEEPNPVPTIAPRAVPKAQAWILDDFERIKAAMAQSEYDKNSSDLAAVLAPHQEPEFNSPPEAQPASRPATRPRGGRRGNGRGGRGGNRNGNRTTTAGSATPPPENNNPPAPRTSGRARGGIPSVTHGSQKEPAAPQPPVAPSTPLGEISNPPATPLRRSRRGKGKGNVNMNNGPATRSLEMKPSATPLKRNRGQEEVPDSEKENEDEAPEPAKPKKIRLKVPQNEILQPFIVVGSTREEGSEPSRKSKMITLNYGKAVQSVPPQHRPPLFQPPVTTPSKRKRYDEEVLDSQDEESHFPERKIKKIRIKGKTSPKEAHFERAPSPLGGKRKRDEESLVAEGEELKSSTRKKLKIKGRKSPNGFIFERRPDPPGGDGLQGGLAC